MFLVGAGCSVSAGIPLASSVAKKAVVKLAASYQPANPARRALATPSEPIKALATLVEDGHFPPQFQPEGSVAPWGELYSYVFSEHIKHPNDQRDFLAGLVATKDFQLNWSHACLGELVKLRFVHTVLTTNFDQLVLKGIIRTGIVPVVADGLESLSRISANPRWPQVVHVHGSMHTYELRNSYSALRETEHDRGLQALMLSVLKETSVLVVVGYSGGEEGIMNLLQESAKALPRMVIYWVAFEPDYSRLSPRARELLEGGEYKYFILNQEADAFFNKLLGELGVGPPGWIKRPLEVLREQIKITSSETTSDDVRLLIKAYEERVSYAIDHGIGTDSSETEATELRSANRFKEAAERIASDTGYRERPSALRIHARSRLDQHNRMSIADVALLQEAIEDLQQLLSMDENASAADVELLIEARRDLFEVLDDGSQRDEIVRAIGDEAVRAQFKETPKTRAWALMDFYKAESRQLEAERLKRKGVETGQDCEAEREAALIAAISAYEAALPILVDKDLELALECREGLAGALSALAELQRETPAVSRGLLRQAKNLFQDVVEFAARNTPGRKLAGALENLATVVQVVAERFPEEAHNARNEARGLLQAAKETYLSENDQDGANRIQEELSKIEQLPFVERFSSSS